MLLRSLLFALPCMVAQALYSQFGPLTHVHPNGTVFLAKQVCLGDLDGDGIQDAAMLGVEGIAFALGDGEGDFGALVIVDPTEGVSVELVVADLDLDGDQDLISLSNNAPPNTISWYENSGNATFSPAQPIIAGPYLRYHPKVTDVDMDGDQDILCETSWGVPEMFVTLIEQTAPGEWVEGLAGSAGHPTFVRG
jgi:hypothetical protein